MELLQQLNSQECTKAEWVDSFSVAGSMLAAMAAAVFLGRFL